MAKIIILNAPPHAGKDTIGNMLIDTTNFYHIVHMSFKAPMFKIAKAMLGESGYDKFMAAYNDRNQKEKPQAFLNGKSPREFMIWISEDVIKPQFGKQYFGERFSQDAKQLGRFHPIICTDGGFPDEVIKLVEDGHKVKLCRLHRTGFTFQGDSRDYISLPVEWHGVNDYEECDFILIDGDPMFTVNAIYQRFIQ